MKRNIEKEYTYYLNLSKEWLPQDILYDVINTLCDDMNLNPQVKFNCLLEMRFASDEDNKTKFSFKINHGEIYYKVTKKTRLSSLDSDLQIYDERISEWRHISEMDPNLFNNDVISYYYKESYKHVISLEDRQFKLNFQDVTFLDSMSRAGNRKYYLEIETKKNHDIRILGKIQKKLETIGWKKLTNDSSKVSIGSDTLSGHYRLSHDLKVVETQVYDIFKRMAIRSMQ